MTRLAVTMIDVGWGDSLLLQSDDSNGASHFALIDCNDTTNERSAYLFVKRYLEKQGVDTSTRFPLFDFVLLTHGHTDHSSGIQHMLSQFGTDWFWYPKSHHSGVAQLVRYANRSRNQTGRRRKVARHQAIDQTKTLPMFGNTRMEVLWPPHTSGSSAYDPNDENNNSIVLMLTHNGTSIVLTGDCEAENWHHFLSSLPTAGLFAIQSPHHGARNGMFDRAGDTPWLNGLAGTTEVIMSSHIRPYGHPHADVISELKSRALTSYRTDEHYHLTLEIEGANRQVKWSRA